MLELSLIYELYTFCVACMKIQAFNVNVVFKSSYEKCDKVALK